MGKRRIKCLVCRCEKEFYPELKFYKLPENRERREIWLNNVGKSDLINANVPQDRRICEKHFSYDMIGKSKLRLQRKAIPFKQEGVFYPAKSINILQVNELIPPKSSESTEISAIHNEGVKCEPESSNDSESSLICSTTHTGTEIGGNYNEDVKDEAEYSNDSTISIIFPTTHNNTEIDGSYNEEVKVEPQTFFIDSRSSLIFPTTHKDAEISGHYNDVKVEPESVFNESKTSLIFPTTHKGADIGTNYKEDVKVEPESDFNEGKPSFIFPATHKSTQTISIVGNSENEVNRLREECEELRRQGNELRKEIDSDAFYIKKSRRILPAELARIVENYLSKRHH